MLAFAICVPNVFIFAESLLKSVSGNKAWPTFGTIFVVSLHVQTSHFKCCEITPKKIGQTFISITTNPHQVCKSGFGLIEIKSTF